MIPLFLMNFLEALSSGTFTTSEIGQYNDATDLYEQGFLAVEA